MNNQNIILEKTNNAKSQQKIESHLIRLLCHINKRFILKSDTCKKWAVTIAGARDEINDEVSKIVRNGSIENIKENINKVYGYIEDLAIKAISKEDHCIFSDKDIKSKNMMQIHLKDIISTNKYEFLNNTIIENEINYLNNNYDNPQSRDSKYYKTHIV